VNFDAKEFLQSLFGTQISEDLPQEWIEDYEERVAILEYDGGLSKEEAEKQAFQEINTRLKVMKKM
jgi:hypothetical protein